MKTVSFIIPVYRNQGSLSITYNRIRELLVNDFAELDYEFVFVNDGSDDGSLSELLNLRAQDRKVSVLSFSRNFGQVAAIIAGLKEVRGDAIVNLSADLQEPVALIGDMIREWQKGSEIVICYRASREDSFAAGIASRIFYRLIRISLPQMPEGGFDFLLIDRKPCDILKSFDERNRFFQGDVLWLGFNTKFIPYHRQKRTIGKSQWTLFKKVKYFIDGFLNTSYLSIRFMSLFGLLTAASGFLYAIVLAYARIVYQATPKGWAPIMMLLLIIGGLIMITLGIIGEYVWRIYDETRKRPLYVIKDRYTD